MYIDYTDFWIEYIDLYESIILICELFAWLEELHHYKFKICV